MMNGKLEAASSDTVLRPAGRETRGAMRTENRHLVVEIIANFVIEVSDVNALNKQQRCAWTLEALSDIRVLPVRATWHGQSGA